ncbi:MAG: trypsin-like serine protease, partial [Anaerolineales bacterium]|nr:trypsin-like serine protease [Anaerolineales bacterium]
MCFYKYWSQSRQVRIFLLLLLVLAFTQVTLSHVSADQVGSSLQPDTIVSSDGLVFSAEQFLGQVDGASSTAFQPSFVGQGSTVPVAPTVDDDVNVNTPPMLGPLPGSVIGPDGRTKVTATTTYPYRAIAYLSVKFPNGGTYGCSGWFIGSRTVATAGHCVYYASYGGWATSVTAYPGKNGSSNPYGSSTKYRLFSVTGWTQNGNWDYDYGAIQLNSALGDTVGWFGFRWQSSNTFSGSYTVTGYPGDKPYGTMWTMSDNPGIRGVNTYHLFYQIDTYGGQSGSPVYHNYSASCNPCSVAIHSYGVGQ